MKHCPDLPHASAERLYAPADIVRSGLCIGCGDTEVRRIGRVFRYVLDYDPFRKFKRCAAGRRVFRVHAGEVL